MLFVLDVLLLHIKSKFIIQKDLILLKLIQKNLKSTESDPEKTKLEETNQKKETIQAGESVLDNSS